MADYTIDYTTIRSPDYWVNTYDSWWSTSDFSGTVDLQPVNWFQDMPTVPDTYVFSYADVGTVAVNLEYMIRDVYATIDGIAPTDTEYGQRVRQVLNRLVNSAENYTDAVNSSYDYSDTLYDLFYLNSSLKLAEKTLDGYSGEVQVDDQVKALRYYVNVLLFSYRQQY